MRYPYLIVSTIMMMAMPTVSTPADEPTADQRLQAARKPPPCSSDSARPLAPAGVFSEAGLVRFRLQAGRIEVDPMRYRKGSEDFQGAGFREQITVASSSGVPSVFYSFQDDYQRLQLIAEHGKSLRIESTLLATGEQGILEQYTSNQYTSNQGVSRPSGPYRVRWTTRRNPAQGSDLDQSISGPTLLHIVGRDEAGFQIHLDPLISRMLLGRSMIELTERTTAYLHQNSADLATISADEVNGWIEQMRSSKSSQRRAAMTALTRYGTGVIPFLNVALQRDDLDVEQITRIRTLVSRCPRSDEDTPSSLACLLASDRDHWQILADKMDQTQWIAANDHIQRCGLDGLTR